MTTMAGVTYWSGWRIVSALAFAAVCGILVFSATTRGAWDWDVIGYTMGLMTDAGVDAAGFDAFAEGEGPAELKRHQQEAEQQGVFAVPTFVVDGELFWGQDRIDFVRAKLAA